MGPKLKVWQVATLGAVLFALGIVLELTVDWGLPGRIHAGSNGILYRRTSATKDLMHKLKWWMTLPVGVGVFFLYAATATYRKQRADEAEEEAAEAAKAARAARADRPEPAGPKPPPAARRPTPPRLGDDPFRDPPRVQIVVHQPVTPRATPIVPGDPSVQPKHLK